jgi:hypothetical protein
MFRPLGHLQVDSKIIRGNITLKMTYGPKHALVSFKQLINTLVLRWHYTLHLYQYFLIPVIMQTLQLQVKFYA